MKIIYCIAATYNSGGMERVLANKANWLAEHGHQVTIVTTDQAGREPFFRMHPAIRHYDLDINYEANNGGHFFTKLLAFPLKQWRHRRRLRLLLRQLNPDITISMFNNDASLLASIPEGGAKLLEVHFSRFKRLQYGRKGLWALADRYRSRKDAATARRYDRFVCLTRQDCEYWEDVPGISVIPNAASFSRTEPAALTAKRVLAVGRLSHQKGFDRLLDAWAAVAPQHPGWHLEIVGSGQLQAELEKQAKHLGISNSITFVTNCTDIRAHYRNASILAMTSRYEGLPMALIEAQTCGLPAVAMDCRCGPRDVISDGVTGFLTSEGDIPAFAERLSTLMSDSRLRQRMGAAAFEQAERFETDRIMGEWIKIFNELTAKK